MRQFPPRLRAVRPVRVERVDGTLPVRRLFFIVRWDNLTYPPREEDNCDDVPR
jgi:hypothetical protein